MWKHSAPATGQEIVLVRDYDGFWGWIIGKTIKLPVYRHWGICRDDALRHIDGRQR